MQLNNIPLNYFANELFTPFLWQNDVNEIAINREGEIWYFLLGYLLILIRLN
jgi:hypothetical protein